MYLFLARHDKGGPVTGQPAGLRSQLDACVREGLGERVDLFDRVIDAAGKDGFAQRDHAVHLVSVAGPCDPVVLSRSHVPADDNPVVRAGEDRVVVLAQRRNGDGLVMALSIY